MKEKSSSKKHVQSTTLTLSSFCLTRLKCKQILPPLSKEKVQMFHLNEIPTNKQVPNPKGTEQQWQEKEQKNAKPKRIKIQSSQRPLVPHIFASLLSHTVSNTDISSQLPIRPQPTFPTQMNE